MICIHAANIFSEKMGHIGHKNTRKSNYIALCCTYVKAKSLQSKFSFLAYTFGIIYISLLK